ncbi:hypothetical protein CEF21_10180 [Bacillus sp. FJAT-42376]|uniref:hypothetical protein n=1 Tax=Bacillus sp. FJAT-42376 TaxID=2014076 RepID=UPI000F50FA83|nr:hypothetical protein [Bacillus sp. FJAT-42376]AZB42625.1 hypothetical protein CEF21_10180 [Bacillus sp. FJAT-42376]
MIVLGIIALLILFGGLFLTVRTGNWTQARKKEFDASAPKTVQAHPYLLNPIFLVYAGAGLLLAILILYFAAKYGY